MLTFEFLDTIYSRHTRSTVYYLQELYGNEGDGLSIPSNDTRSNAEAV